jgi:threonine dehydrogenase-like Zn-dependent dehydrogenase
MIKIMSDIEAGEWAARVLCWFGKGDVRIETVSDPKILNRRDAIVQVTTTAICGSDLHLYGGYVPMMQEGDILGHELMGEVVEIGPNALNGRSSIPRSSSPIASA